MRVPSNFTESNRFSSALTFVSSTVPFSCKFLGPYRRSLQYTSNQHFTFAFDRPSYPLFFRVVLLSSRINSEKHFDPDIYPSATQQQQNQASTPPLEHDRSLNNMIQMPDELRLLLQQEEYSKAFSYLAEREKYSNNPDLWNVVLEKFLSNMLMVSLDFMILQVVKQLKFIRYSTPLPTISADKASPSSIVQANALKDAEAQFTQHINLLFKYFQHMVDNDRHVHPPLFSKLIKIFAEYGDVDACRLICENSLALANSNPSNCPLNLQDFKMIMLAALKFEQFNLITWIFDEFFMSALFRPDPDILSLVLYACQQRGNEDRILRLLDLITKDTSLEISERAYVHCMLGLIDNWKAAKKVLYDLRKSTSLRPSSQAYMVAILSCARALEWNHVIDIARDSIKSRCRLDVITCNVYLYALNQLSRFREIDIVFDNMVHQVNKVFPKPDIISYNTYIAACEHNKDGDKALMIYEDMQNSGFSPDLITYTSCIAACSKSGYIDKALQLLEALRKSALTPNIKTYGAVLAADKISSDVVFSLFREMIQSGIAPDAIAYSSCLKVCARDGNWKNALYIFEHLKTHSKELLSRELYNAIINACAKGKNPVMAVEYFEEMIYMGIKPDLISYNGIINAFERVKNWTMALKTLERMKRENIGPDLYSYNICLSALDKSGENDKATAFFQELLASRLTPDVFSYNSYISAYARKGKWNEALSILNYMKKHVTPDIITYNTCITACKNGSNYQEALKLLQEVKNLGIRPNTVTYSSCISACQHMGDWNTALKLLHEMKIEQIQPNIIVYNSCISVCAKAKKHKYVLKLFSEVHTFRLRPTVVTYNSCLHCFENCRQYDLAEDCYYSMKAAKVDPDYITLSIMMRVLNEIGKYKESIAIFNQLKTGRFLRATNYGACVKAVAMLNMWEKALDLLETMKNKQFTITSDTYKYCIMACNNNEKWDKVLDLYNETKQMNITVSNETKTICLTAARNINDLAFINFIQGELTSTERKF